MGSGVLVRSVKAVKNNYSCRVAIAQNILCLCVRLLSGTAEPATRPRDETQKSARRLTPVSKSRGEVKRCFFRLPYYFFSTVHDRASTLIHMWTCQIISSNHSSQEHVNDPTSSARRRRQLITEPSPRFRESARAKKKISSQIIALFYGCEKDNNNNKSATWSTLTSKDVENENITLDSDTFHLILIYCYKVNSIQPESNYIYYSQTKCCKPLAVLITAPFLQSEDSCWLFFFLSYFILLLSNFLLKALIIPALKMNNNCCPTAYGVCWTEE